MNSVFFYNPTTPSLRNYSTLNFYLISSNKKVKLLTRHLSHKKGRNNKGRITVRHRGGGHKKIYRIIDHKRNKIDMEGEVISIHYDPNRNANIALIHYFDGDKRYILHPQRLNIGDFIISDNVLIPAKVGNSLRLDFVPLGAKIHNIEFNPYQGGKIARAAGTFGKVLARKKKFVLIRLSSNEVRLIPKICKCTIGKVGNRAYFQVYYGKAGRMRWLGIRPSTRGSAMNPIDHPHGGGEGRCPIGRKTPVTPWGKPTLGLKTRKIKNKTNIFVIHKFKSLK